jgi:hypothetical protein
VPAELKGLVRKVADAYQRGDARARDSAAAVGRHLVLVARGDLGAPAIREKAVTLDEIEKRGAPAGGGTAPQRILNPYREAARIFRGADVPATAPRRVAPPAGSAVQPGAAATPASAQPDRPNLAGRAAGRGLSTTARFRDWNPDLRVARELGVRVEYVSARNEVSCPELRLSSRDRDRASGLSPRLTSRGVSFGPATSIGGVDSAHSAAPGAGEGMSSAGSSSRGHADRAAASSADRGSKGGSEGGKIKN